MRFSSPGPIGNHPNHGNFTNAIKVMSFNIRFDNYEDGENRWSNRRNAVINMINEYQPDIIGMQEALHNQVEFLDEQLESSYNWMGVGRDDGATRGEYAPVFYNKNRFTMVSNGTFWLSTTPEQVSVGWDAALERIVTWAELQETSSGRSVWIFNTHFDHKGTKARLESARLLAKRAKEMVTSSKVPVFITGDLNTPWWEPRPINALREAGFWDTRKMALKVITPKPTSNGFGSFFSPFVGNIDFVFCKKDITAVDSVETIIKKYGNVKYISDHYPVIASMRY